MFLFFISLSSGCKAADKAADSKALPAPEFELKDLGGNTVSLSNYRGKSTVALIFWTTWCPHCRAQLLTLSKEYLQTKGKNIEILTVNIQENKSKVESFLKKYKAGFNTVLDLRGKVATLYEVEGVPTFYFISQEGKIIYVSNFLPSNYTEKFLEE